MTLLDPYDPHDFTDWCEDCGAAPGMYCYPGCGSGYTAADARDYHRPDE